MIEVVVMLSFFVYLLRLKNIIALAPFHQACLNWPSELEQGNILKDITYLELIPIALSVYLWGNQWHGKTILFHSDNQSVEPLETPPALSEKRFNTELETHKSSKI
jgi:hypothetical protein